MILNNTDAHTVKIALYLAEEWEKSLAVCWQEGPEKRQATNKAEVFRETRERLFSKKETVSKVAKADIRARGKQ